MSSYRRWQRRKGSGEIPHLGWSKLTTAFTIKMSVIVREYVLPSNKNLYIGWSDVTYLWSQCDRHFVGQHVVLCVVKWRRFVALFESNWISWFKKMSVLSLSCRESDVYWRRNNKHFAELAPQNGGKQLIWRNYVTATLCITEPRV